jgi:hypothetical protein
MFLGQRTGIGIRSLKGGMYNRNMSKGDRRMEGSATGDMRNRADRDK